MLKILKINSYCLLICLIISVTSNSYAQITEEKAPSPILRPVFKHMSSDFLILEVREGDTLSGILEEAGVSKGEAAEAINELRNVYNPSALKVGQKVRVHFDLTEKANEIEFISMQIKVAPDKEVQVSKLDNNLFLSQKINKPLTSRLSKVHGTIESTLFGAAQEAGLPSTVLADLIKLYSYDVDFQRDIRKGNSFKVIFEELVDDEEGKVVDSGNIISAALTLKNKEFKIYRHQTPDNEIDYYNEDGESIRKSLLRTPIDGARITSGYGKRRHPTLGYTKLHKGIDFGAPRGTPIYAAGDGIVERAGRFGSYGKFVRIAHNNGYSTAYAHLSRYGQKIRTGIRVKQGQVIGYVGTTGRSTGPHLHYEVLVDKRQINPLSIKTVSGRKLKNLERAIFFKHIAQIEDLENNIKLAQKY